MVVVVVGVVDGAWVFWWWRVGSWSEGGEWSTAETSWGRKMRVSERSFWAFLIWSGVGRCRVLEDDDDEDDEDFVDAAEAVVVVVVGGDNGDDDDDDAAVAGGVISGFPLNIFHRFCESSWTLRLFAPSR